MVCGPALSPRSATSVSPARSTTTTEQAKPFSMQLASAVSAMVLAIARERSLRERSWAVAGAARAQARAMSETRRQIADMTRILPFHGPAKVETRPGRLGRNKVVKELGGGDGLLHRSASRNNVQKDVIIYLKLYLRNHCVRISPDRPAASGGGEDIG